MTSVNRRSVEAGDVFDGRYRILEPLGEGSFATVFKAVQTVYGVKLRTVALKVFKGNVKAENAPEIFHDAVALQGLLDESPEPEVERRLIHILDGGVAPEHSGAAYLAMEYVPSSSLEQVVRRYSGLPGVGGLPVELALHYITEILLPLAWMHTRPTPAVHGDLHSGNVLVGPDGTVKLADFGLAERLPGLVMGGALKCQAPETLLGQLGDTRSDVYAIGLLAYELLTDRYPFEDEALERLSLVIAEEREEIRALQEVGQLDEAASREIPCNRKQHEYVAALVARRRQQPPPPSATNEQLRDMLGLEDIVQKCLEFAPSRRFFDAMQVKKALDDYLSGRGSPAMAARRVAPETPSPPPRPAAVDMSLDQLRRLCERGEFVQAQELADRIAGRHPGSPEGWLAKAEVALATAREDDAREQRIDQALEFLARAQRLEKEDPRVLEMLAAAYRLARQSGMAETMKARANALRRQQARSR